ncbi:MAG: HD domain-containing protein [Candidatus Niameybacter stercoravium]|nr:HD domain-containing protein [Candidatus Niameybacter stercoravium]
MIEVGLFFSQIIDFRCNFTATHSSGIAAVSSELARLYGLSKRECALMRFAGDMHDIGKLAVPIEIIEKQGELNEEEARLIKMHTYYTYQILSDIEGIGQVREWAAYHHEKNDGTGYPFGLSGNDISEGCKIIKVADIFTALRGERPYRPAMKKEKVLHVFEHLEEDEEILHGIINCLKENYDKLDKVSAKAQEEAIERYKAFIE